MTTSFSPKFRMSSKVTASFPELPTKVQVTKVQFCLDLPEASFNRPVFHLFTGSGNSVPTQREVKMKENKAVLWILEEDLNRQFLFSELLDETYDLYFFDTVESLRLYHLASGRKPQLLIADVLTAEQGLRAVLVEAEGFNRCPVLMLNPPTVPQVVADKYRMYVREILFSPYSQTQVLKAIARLVAQPETDLSAMNLIRFETYTPRRLAKNISADLH